MFKIVAGMNIKQVDLFTTVNTIHKYTALLRVAT